MMKNIILINIPRKCENPSISFLFKSITFEFARGQQSTSVQIAVASLVGHCEIARSFFRDCDGRKKRKKREKNPDYSGPSIIPHLRSPN